MAGHGILQIWHSSVAFPEKIDANLSCNADIRIIFFQRVMAAPLMQSSINNF